MTVVDETEFEYAGFWVRVGAALIDTVLVLFLTVPLLRMVYGSEYGESERLIQGPADFLISWLLPAIAAIAFWVARGATPGKMAISAQVVDARSGKKPGTGQAIGRYLGYYVSTIPLGLGLIWVAFDPKKQGWHDKLAGTVVIRRKGGGTRPVSFEHAGKDTPR
ncbi:RDD family protein [Massilia suwonensis]|uniref:RDD family protein n=1 Tax=Massilia suwonensis TaxID=648895 RepID=A0ABW0MR54_9BURK